MTEMAGSNGSRIEVKPEVVFLGKLLERYISGRIRSPRFQRPFVWKHSDIISLLDSVYNGYPIGSLLLWETDSKVQTLDRVGPIRVSPEPGGALAYLLDGQQRLITLAGTLLLPNGERFVDDIDWSVYFDLDEEKFCHEPKHGVEAHHFPVRALLSTGQFLNACKKIHEKLGAYEEPKAMSLVDRADKLANAFRDYTLPVVTIRAADISSAVTAFARLNQRGRKMSADQMVSALTYREGGFDLSEQLDQLEDDLASEKFGNLDRVFLLRAVLAALDLDLYGKEWSDLTVADDALRGRLPECLRDVRDALDRAVRFLRELGVVSDRLLPYGLQLVLLSEFFRLCPEPSGSQKQTLAQWFWVTSFTGWFAGMNSSQARMAVKEMRQLALEQTQYFTFADFKTPAQPFPARFDARSARARAFLLFLSSLGPRSLKSDESLDVGHLLSSQGSRALSYIVSARLPDDLGSSPANRMFTDEGHRGQVVRQIPAATWQDPGHALLSHGFPPDTLALLNTDDREALISSRLQYLTEQERAFILSKGVVPAPEGAISHVVADSDTSDTDDD
jgi:hypothetical protein